MGLGVGCAEGVGRGVLGAAEDADPELPEEPEVEDPVVDESVVDDPALDDPLAEEPALEEPEVEEPLLEDPVFGAWAAAEAGRSR